MKGFTQTDYIVAIGIFIFIFGVVVFYVTQSVAETKEFSEIDILTKEARVLLSRATSERLLTSEYYQFYVFVNNTKRFYYNQSINESNISNEIISINISNMVENASMSSVNVFDYGGNIISHGENEGNITILIPILNVNEINQYIVRFDDGGNFTYIKSNFSGNDILREMVTSIDEINVIDYYKLNRIKNMTKEELEDKFGMRNFYVVIYDMISSEAIEFGWNTPPRGNIVSIQRYVMFENSTGALRPGKLVIRKWI